MARRFVAASSQFLEVNAAVVSAAPLTMACWFFPVATNVSYNLLDIGDGTGGSSYFNLYARPASTAVIGAAAALAGTESVASSTNTYQALTWSHACGVFTSATSRAAFLNGTGKGTNATSRTPSGLAVTTIGCYRGSGTTAFGPMNGAIAEVGIWNVALDDAEIALLARPGVTPNMVRPEALVFYAPLLGPELLEGLQRRHTIAPVNGTDQAAHPFSSRVPLIRGALFNLGAEEGGGGSVSGTSALTQTAATTATSGAETITGTSAVTQAAATTAASGAQTISGTCAVTQSAATTASSGAETISGSSPVSQAAATTASSGTETIAGSSSPSQTAATTSSTGAETIAGTSAATQSAATQAATSSTENSGTSSVTQSSGSQDASGTLTITGSSSATQSGATTSASGAQTINGAGGSTQGAATHSASGALRVNGSCATSHSAATSSASGSQSIAGSISVTQSPATQSATDALPSGAFSGAPSFTSGRFAGAIF